MSRIASNFIEPTPARSGLYANPAGGILPMRSRCCSYELAGPSFSFILKFSSVGKEDNSQEGSPTNAVGTRTLNEEPSTSSDQKVAAVEVVVRPGESGVELVLEGGAWRVK
jgi:hypothetical protein